MDKHYSHVRVQWPDYYMPMKAPVYVRNEILIQSSLSAVWDAIVNYKAWPLWYRNSSDVHGLTLGCHGRLNAGTRFKWKTFGVNLISKVEEYEPGHRVSWTAKGFGVEAYRGWVLKPQDGGCLVVTEETQYGWGAIIKDRLLPTAMYRGHQLWLESLKKLCE